MGPSSSYRIEVGKEIVVQCCCSSNWDQDVVVKAFISNDAGDRELNKESRDPTPKDQFPWTPDIAEGSSFRTQLRCEARVKVDRNGTKPSREMLSPPLLSQDIVDVTIVFAPQPHDEDVFVAVEDLGSQALATITVQARPEVDKDSVVWELAGNVMEKVRPTSPIQGYMIEFHKVGVVETNIVLKIDSVKETDLGTHLVTVKNEIGSYTYKVRFFKGEMAKVFIHEVKSGEFLAGKTSSLECRSEGGNPPPVLRARIRVNGKNTRNLKLTEEDDGSHPNQKRRRFLLNPMVEERSDGKTFVVCEAVQRAGKQQVYTDVEAKSQINIVYPPQAHKNTKKVKANVGESVSLSMTVDAFPLPDKSDVVWSAAETNSNYRMNVAFTSSSITTIYITVDKVEEHDFNTRQTLTVKNVHGEQSFHFQIIKPTPTWVWVLIGLGILLLIASCVAYKYCWPVYRGMRNNV